MEHFFKSRPALWGWLLLAVGGPSAFAAEGGQEAEAAPARLVDVNEYFVRGDTVLDARAIEEAVYPFLGPQKGLERHRRRPGGLAKGLSGPGLSIGVR